MEEEAPRHGSSLSPAETGRPKVGRCRSVRSTETFPLQVVREAPAEVYYLLKAGENGHRPWGAIKHHLASQDFRTKIHRTFLSLFSPRTVLFCLQVRLNIPFLVLNHLCRSYNTISGFFSLCL